jgi:hypothetical protein
MLKASNSPKSTTLIFCVPNPNLDACVLCDSHGYSDLNLTELLDCDWFEERYGHTYTWEHWGDENHRWDLVSTQRYENPSQSVPNVLVLFYTPVNPELIESWLLGN